MKKQSSRIMVIAVLSILFLFGCEDIIDDGLVTSEDSTAAVLRADSARAALEEVMEGIFDADPDSVQGMLDALDFSEANALYVGAHELDPENSDANFGMAFTGFLMLTQDQQLQDMLLRWESYFKANEPFLVDSSQSTLGKRGFGLPMTVDGIRVPIASFIETPIGLAKMSIDDVPQFSEFQALVDNLFLPIIEESIIALELLDDDQNYVFNISPTMQGDTEADPIELDLTEIYALEAGLYALKGVLKTVVAYNFDVVSFDSLGIVTELSQGSDFATLKANGAADLAEALLSANTAFDKIIAALDFLEAETDDQSDDLIHFEASDDPAEIRSDIEEVQSALQTPTLIHYSYYEDVYDEYGNWVDEIWYEDSITVDISQFFENPIQDFKAMLPPYTMGTQIYYDTEYMHIILNVHHEEASVTVPGLSNMPIEVNLNYYIDEFGSPVNYAWAWINGVGIDLSAASASTTPAAVLDLYAEYEALIAQYTGSAYEYLFINFYWSGTLTTGTSLAIDADFTIEYETMGWSYVEPHPVWVDTTYADWLAAWPDPTMHGIFPGLDAAGLAEFLDADSTDW